MKRAMILAGTLCMGALFGSAAAAQSAGNLLGAPVVAAGSGLYGAAAAHAGIAPTVSQAAPAAEPLTDGVTNAIAAAGSGVTGTGQNIQANGVSAGTGADGRPLVSVGANAPANQGSVAAVLNGHP